MDPTGTTPALALVDLMKNFGPNRVLKGVDLQLFPGKVTALLGANGAGKSTLIKVLAGVHDQTAGQVQVGGKTVEYDTPMGAVRLGIRTVHQRIDDAIVPGLSVAENLLFEEIALGETARIASLRSLLPRAREIAATLDLDWDDAFLRQDVYELGIADCQMLLLARALSTTPEVLILDEPTSTLSQSESERLFAIVRKLRDRGVAILYVSHRLSEINSLADELAVLRDGRIVDTQTLPFNLGAAVTAMLGEGVLSDAAQLDELRGTEAVLRIEGHQIFESSRPIDLEIRGGEVTGVIGLIGAGKTELAERIFGAGKNTSGTMTLQGAPFAPTSPKAAIAQGVYLVPEDRAAQGMLPGWSVARTLSLPFLSDVLKGLTLSTAKESSRAQHAIDQFAVVTTGPEQAVDALSGGNQQKVMVARWMQRSPKVLVLDEPFRGVDIGARRVISTRAREQAANGSAVVMICSDVEEIREMADRIIVMVEGTITLDARAQEITNEQIVQSMTEVA
ncbi:MULTISPECIES: sugar ABC transporter ATP-binding protein [unclassified Leucobacter]|uniref:sugar ABC transporter ATP-binding protein n=1 Tax=unclassified Leucobacter TaxID=2621730 RepID=UPI00165E7D5D|nr:MULTISPECIES: sugar ABC transporter ATP-binding protein [unclassified Leucobacter]MBC9926437.1 sugar ABC transporter ATP-binding protein [Leucobacter sp. cx-169]